MRTQPASLLTLLLATILVGCRPLTRAEMLATPALPAGSCTLELPSSASDEAAIRALLRAEGELVVSQEIDRLMALWAEGSRIVNAKNTPNDESDDQLWMDKDAVRHRYVRTVFPGAPAAATPADLAIRIDGATASVTATTQIGSEISPAGDRWELHKQAGCWLISQLVYNLEPAP